MLRHLVALGLLAIAMPASAATVTYTLSGTFAVDGLPDTDPITAAIRFTGIGDTDDFATISAAGTAANLFALTAFHAELGDQDMPFGSAVSFIASRENGVIGFGDAAAGIAVLFRADRLLGYDGRSSIGPVSVSYLTTMGPAAGPGQAGTYGPSLTIANATFSATVAAVPEPAAWALMIGGFGVAGVGLRGRPRGGTLPA